MLRSNVRNACYRMKAGAPLAEGQEEIVELITEAWNEEDDWQGFNDSWDVVVKDGKIIRVGTETDEIFVNDLCVAIKTKLEAGLSLEKITSTFTDREQNVYDVIQLNYLGPKVEWSEYKKTWNTSIDWDRRKIDVYSMKTVKTEIKPKEAPKKSLRKAVKETMESEDAIVAKIKQLLKDKE